jgi:predicted transcriptional regulator
MIMLEITQNMRLLLPLMAVIMVSKFVADRVAKSVYDIGIELNPNIHMIEGELDDDLVESLTVVDVSSTQVVSLNCQEKVDKIANVLVQTTYQGFPLIDGSSRQVRGLILRSKLLKAFGEKGHSSDRWANNQLLDLLPYADTSPEVKLVQTPLSRAHRHFKAMGLGHLIIVDCFNRLVGILTRSDVSKLSDPKVLEEAQERVIRHKALGMSGPPKAYTLPLLPVAEGQGWIGSHLVSSAESLDSPTAGNLATTDQLKPKIASIRLAGDQFQSSSSSGKSEAGGSDASSVPGSPLTRPARPPSLQARIQSHAKSSKMQPEKK